MLLGRRKLLITTFAIILVPILLAMTPLGLIVKSGSLSSKDLQVRRGIHIPLHSISVTQDDDTGGPGFVSISRTKEPKVLLHFLNLNPGFVLSNVFSDSVPLRC
jgi:hypothetical protein